MPAAAAAASSTSSSSASNWLSTWRKSLACRTQANEVHDPRHRQHNRPQAAAQDMAPDPLPPTTAAALLVNHAASIASGGSANSGGGGGSMRRFHIGGAGQGHYLRSGCSRSIANLKDVIHSSRRMDILSSNHHHRDSGIGGMANFSPKSVESSDFVQSISREAMFKDHGELCEHIIRPFGQGSKLSVDDIVANHNYHSKSSGSNGSSSVLKTGTGGSGHFYGTPLHSSAHYSGEGASSTASSTPLHYYSSSSTKSSSSHGNSLMKLSGCYDCKNPAVSLVVYKSNGGSGSLGPTASTTGRGSSSHQHHQVITTPICRRCNEVFSKYEALEKHHLLKHAVTELSMGDSSRNVVEIIFRTSWMTAGAAAGGRRDMQVLQVTGAVKIERVLKVNNLPRTLARFEAYRDGVKMKAGKLIPKKHPRCLADGNELLRFYAAKLECGLVSSTQVASNPSGEYKTNDMNSTSRSGAPPSSLPFGAACSSPTCSICRIIRSGFSKSRAPDGSNRGILTTATSGRAHDILQQKMVSSGESLSNNNCGTGRNLMAMLVCRVIAGRVQKPAASGVLDTVGFDSVAGGDTSVASTSSSHYSLTEAAAVGLHSRFEELTVFSPRAILPCFVVLYSCATNKP